MTALDLIALNECTPTAQWLFDRIRPLMEAATPPGWLPVYESELSVRLKVGKSTISYALHDLKNHNILRKGVNGWYCPMVVKEFVGNGR